MKNRLDLNHSADLDGVHDPEINWQSILLSQPFYLLFVLLSVAWFCC